MQTKIRELNFTEAGRLTIPPVRRSLVKTLSLLGALRSTISVLCAEIVLVATGELIGLVPQTPTPAL